MKNSKHIIACAAVAACGLLAEASHAFASNYWNNAGTGFYDTATNWSTSSTAASTGTVPTSSTTAYVEDGGIAVSSNSVTDLASTLAIGADPSVNAGTGEMDVYGQVSVSTLTEVGSSNGQTPYKGAMVFENTSATLTTANLDVWASGDVEIINPSATIVAITSTGLVQLFQTTTSTTNPGSGAELDITDPNYASFELATYATLSTSAGRTAFTTIDLNGIELIGASTSNANGTSGSNGSESLSISYGTGINSEIYVTVTPEPGAAGLLALSSAVVALRRRRRGERARR